MISIITVCFNNKFGLEKTINSLRYQTIKDYEFIIVDGASSDGSIEIIKLNSDIVTSWISESDNGIYHAMNKGIRMVTGEYCLFLNAGDYFIDKYVLEALYNNSTNIDILYGDAVKVKSHYRRIIKYPSKLTLYNFYQDIAAIHHQAALIKKSLFDEYGYYREDLKIIADWEFFFRVVILNRVTTKHISRVICLFDGSGLSNSLKKNDMISIEAAIDKQLILKEHFPDFILDDYKILKSIVSKRTFFRRVFDKLSYFRMKKQI